MKRSRAKPRRALFEAKVMGKVRRDFQTVVLQMGKHHAEEIAAERRHELELEEALVDLRHTVDVQRRILVHPWAHLWRWIISSPAIRQRKEVE